MKREEVIKLLQEELERCQRAPELNGCEMKPEWQRTMDVCRVAVEAIREQEQRRWIPVTERFPDVGKNVLVYSEFDFVSVDYHGGDSFGYALVTHWMPLPEPPKEE